MVRTFWSRVVLFLGVIAFSVAISSGVYFLFRWTFSYEEVVREASRLNARALKIQLDQETAMRGFVATRWSTFLAPSPATRDMLGGTMDALEKSLRELRMIHALRDTAEMRKLHDTWKSQVAIPAIRSTKISVEQLLLGKAYMDRFRFLNDQLDERIRIRSMQGEEHLTVLVASSVFVISILLMSAVVSMLRLTRMRNALQLKSRALAESEALLWMVLDKVPQMVWMTTSEGANEYCNAAWYEYTGTTLEGARGDQWFQTLHPDDLGHAVEAWRNALQEKEAYDIEFRVRARDGSYRWFLTRANPIRDEHGEIFRWVGTCTDIERRRQSELEQALLAEASRILSEAFDEPTTLRALTLRSLPCLADWCRIDLSDDPRDMYTAAIAHVDPQKDALLQSEVNRRIRIDTAIYHAQVIMSGKTLLFERVPPSVMHACFDAPSCELCDRIGFHSMAIAPLIVRGRTLGTLTYVYDDSRRTYGAADLGCIEELARRIALALDNAQLYAREHRASVAFQDAALPKTLPTIPGLSFEAVYQAAKNEALVGGDWYDAFTLPDGRIVMSIGDVMGSGLDAAVTMGAVRQAIRGAAQIDAEPIAVLDAADRALRSEQPDRIVTAFIAVLNPHTWTLTYESAGHPPALLRLTSGTIVELRGSGLPLGLRAYAGESTHARSKRFLVKEPALLVLYTDGVTESKRDIEEGERRLREIVQAEAMLSASDPARLIKRAIGDSPDDVAILTVWMKDVQRKPIIGLCPPQEAGASSEATGDFSASGARKSSS